jgi:hypothetical protein
VTDALLGALGRDRLGAGALPGIERAARARALLADISRQIAALGPAKDSELEEAAQARWWDLARPRMIRVTHAVALTKDADDQKANAVAEKIVAAVKGISDLDEWKKIARSVPSDGIQVRVEDLDPVAADGRTVDPNEPHPAGFVAGSFDQDFVRAVFAMPAPKSPNDAPPMSPVVKTKFGYHVIRFVEEIPEHRASPEALRTELSSAVFEQKGKLALEELKSSLRKSTPVDVDRAAVELMGTVIVSP